MGSTSQTDSTAQALHLTLLCCCRQWLACISSFSSVLHGIRSIPVSPPIIHWSLWQISWLMWITSIFHSQNQVTESTPNNARPIKVYNMLEEAMKESSNRVNTKWPIKVYNMLEAAMKGRGRNDCKNLSWSGWDSPVRPWCHARLAFRRHYCRARSTASYQCRRCRWRRSSLAPYRTRHNTV